MSGRMDKLVFRTHEEHGDEYSKAQVKQQLTAIAELWSDGKPAPPSIAKQMAKKFGGNSLAADRTIIQAVIKAQ